MTSLRLITGATGLLGRFVAGELASRGLPVRVLVRPTSDRGVLDAHVGEGRAVEFVTGDLSEATSLNGILDGVTHVYHCAARLGDWGPWEEFERGIVATTRHLVDQCLDSSIERFVHVSSVAAYGHLKASPPWDESQPLGQNLWWWDYYARAKMLAEQQAFELGARVTVVRPTWIYGPGDQTILPRILKTLRDGRVTLLGSGDNLLNLVHAEDVASGVVAAGETATAAGRAFNLCSDGEITQKEFFNLLADEKGWRSVQKSAPLWAAYPFGFLNECYARATRRSLPPRVTRHGISLLTRPVHFSTEAAKEVLGWQRTRSVRESLIEAVESIELDA